MICQPCGHGGFANKIGAFEDASRLHHRCKGCPCQHHVGPGTAIVPVFK